jgi:hypothetical protein
MQLTDKQGKVVEHLRRCRVATMNEMVQSLDLSHMTVVRALKKYGYYTSFNHTAGFYTLQDTPRFDRRGLWFCADIGFSQHGNLKQTLLALIEQSEAGCTVAELQQTLVPNLDRAVYVEFVLGSLDRLPIACRPNSGTIGAGPVGFLCITRLTPVNPANASTR